MAVEEGMGRGHGRGGAVIDDGREALGFITKAVNTADTTTAPVESTFSEGR